MKIITRYAGNQWIATRAGDEHHGARGYGATEAEAIRNLSISFPDDGPAELVLADLMPGFSPASRANVLGAAVRSLRGKLDAAAPDCANDRE